tara:strand:- start:788 stop:1969 length:1182 start_codon:yes stop_codon:yes gene_type:complete
MNINIAFVILVFVAIGIGWFLGRHAKSKSQAKRPSVLSKNYFVGLNYLLNEQPDKAVDIFIRMLDVDSDTVETHLAIGNLFRRRGEVDRAIRIHQNLIARPNLNKRLRIQALLELGRDYMHAGVYDRAERLFLEAIDSGGQLAAAGLKYLLTIYQHEKDWHKAIEYANQLQQQTNEDVGQYIANYYCEMIEASVESLSNDQIQQMLKKALSADKNSVRVSLIEAKLYQQQGDLKSAIKSYKHVKKQDEEYITEIIEPIVSCYEQLGDDTGLVDYLYQCLNDCPRLPIILVITQKLQQWHDIKVATDFLIEQIRKYPSMKGLNSVIDYLMKTAEAHEKHDLQVLQSLLQHSLHDKPSYQCQRCGFESKNLDWLCPGCKNWNTIKPITDGTTNES